MPPTSLPPVLAELIHSFGPLASERHDLGGAVTLHTPGVNVLALNAAFLPDADPARLAAVAAAQRARGRPALVATAVPVAGEEVGAVRVGTYLPQPDPGRLVVEQVSRLSLPVWAAVLAEAHGTPDWAPALARHLAARLEGDRDAALLLAYAGGEAVGALLWRAGPGGGSAHLWGTLDPGVDAPLLNAAGALGAGVDRPLRVSLPDTSPLTVQGEQVVRFVRPTGTS